MSDNVETLSLDVDQSMCPVGLGPSGRNGPRRGTLDGMNSPVSAADVAAVRQPVDRASLLPPRVFHDPAVFDFERNEWFARTWLCVGRAEDVGQPGTYFLARVAGEGVIVMRDRRGTLRAFFNVCRHRGSTLLDEPADGRVTDSVVRIQCPYHAWIYELDGTLRRAPHTDEIIDFEL